VKRTGRRYFPLELLAAALTRGGGPTRTYRHDGQNRRKRPTYTDPHSLDIDGSIMTRDAWAEQDWWHRLGIWDASTRSGALRQRK